MIDLFYIDTDIKLADEEGLKKWLNEVVAEYNKEITELSYIFSTDEYVLQINQDYLNHDYFTDVITFDYCEEDNISGDIFISIDRVRDNSRIFGVTFCQELLRVMVHGVLHLLGYKDSTPEEKQQMRDLEDKFINLNSIRNYNCEEGV